MVDSALLHVFFSRPFMIFLVKLWGTGGEKTAMLMGVRLLFMNLYTHTHDSWAHSRFTFHLGWVIVAG